jgi:hypothetical protein
MFSSDYESGAIIVNQENSLRCSYSGTEVSTVSSSFDLLGKLIVIFLLIMPSQSILLFSEHWLELPVA